jgi:hypothetical protein
MLSCCGDVDCLECNHGQLDPSEEGDLFQAFRDGMYRAADMLGDPREVLLLLASSVSRTEVIGRFAAWVESR